VPVVIPPQRTLLGHVALGMQAGALVSLGQPQNSDRAHVFNPVRSIQADFDLFFKATLEYCTACRVTYMCVFRICTEMACHFKSVPGLTHRWFRYGCVQRLHSRVWPASMIVSRHNNDRTYH
jgi:hypothetical protein